MPKNADRSVKRAIDSLADAIDGPILFIVKGLEAYRGKWGSASSAIGPEDELKVKEQLDCLRGSYRSVAVCINAFGGSSTSAFNITRLLRSRFARITAYIPHAAASAGTLLTLCADLIYISGCGYLTMVDPMLRFGPLLVQATQILAAGAASGTAWAQAEFSAAQSSMRMIEDQLTEVLRKSGYSKAAQSRIKTKLLLQEGFHDAPLTRDELRAAGVRVAPSNQCDSSHELLELERILRLLVASKLDGFVRTYQPE